MRGKIQKTPEKNFFKVDRHKLAIFPNQSLFQTETAFTPYYCFGFCCFRNLSNEIKDNAVDNDSGLISSTITMVRIGGGGGGEGKCSTYRYV